LVLLGQTKDEVVAGECLPHLPNYEGILLEQLFELWVTHHIPLWPGLSPISLPPWLHFPPKRPVEKSLEQMLRLALRLALLDARPLEFVERSLFNTRHMPPTRIGVEMRITVHYRIQVI
jgi:hypothetical protein